MKGIILHGGHGTRLRPLTHTGPKQLLPIANKPMSQYCVESLKDAGVKDIAIIIGGIGAHKVKEYYGRGEKFGVNITYINQDYPKGIAHAIRLCKDFIQNDKFLVFLGDNVILRSIKDFAKKFDSSNLSASILLCKVDNPSRFGIAEVKDEKIIKITEKPKNPTSNLAVTGIYFLTPIIFDIIDRLKPSWRNEFEITDALQMLLETGQEISYNMTTDYWKDTGTPEDIISANKAILNKMEPYFKGKKENTVTISGRVMVGNGTTIKDSSTIIGPVVIGEDCIIEKNTRIGPNTSIGNNCHLSKCNIENSIIMKHCEIYGNIKIKDSIIATNSIIELNRGKKDKIFLLGEGTKIIL